ncbi:MAG: AAA family ATPase [Spirochaetaceae bacterium]|nr:AAA family ATPase [Spirochaetaceae bacterium]
MKKKNVINLIKWYSEKNDSAFRAEAYEIVKEFDQMGDYQLAEYIMALLSSTDTFVPQYSENDFSYFKKIEPSQEPLPLPDAIKEDVIGIVNAVGHNIGVNKFLFQGKPGTGKTETVKQLARILERELFMVDFSAVVESKLGQTSKNIVALFKEINELSNPQKVIILFDEIDAIALDRNNSNDLREMGRATSTILKELENMNDSVILIATTNLFDIFDKALTRRFDSVINFNRYSREDLIEIAEVILNNYLDKVKFAGRNIRLFRKIIALLDPIPYPGDLINIIKTSIAFSNPGNEFDYLKRLYQSTYNQKDCDIKLMKNQGFTVREIEILTGISKSQVSRDLKE